MPKIPIISDTVTKLRVMKQVQATIADLSEKTRMGFSWAVVIQTLLAVAQILNQIEVLVPHEYKPHLLGLLLAIQFITAIVNLFLNPDGKSATQPWEKPQVKPPSEE